MVFQIKRALLTSLLAAFAFLMCASFANAEGKVEMGLSVDVVPIGSDFAGRDIVIFGALVDAKNDAIIRGEFDVIIEVIGEAEEVAVRKKERIFGIWVNAASRNYRDVPSYYSVVASKNLKEIADLSLLSSIGIGVDNIQATSAGTNNVLELLTQGEFNNALRRKRIESGLFSENLESLENLSPYLFRATLFLPPTIPIGYHTVRAHLFQKGVKVDHAELKFEVRKIGFERWIYNLAKEYSLLYGLLAVALAIFTGWFANLVFRKN